MYLQENIPLITKISGTQIQLAASYLGQSGRINVGGQQYRLTTALQCNLATTGFGGLDTGSLAANTLYYIYVVVNGSNAAGLVCSTSNPAVGPTGFTAWREVGRFRTFLGSAAVGVVVNRFIGGSKSRSSGSWTAWSSPSIDNITVGNGVVTARYKRSYDDMLLFYMLVWGTTTSFAGAPNVASLPDLLSIDLSNLPQQVSTVGKVTAVDTGVNTYYGRSIIEAANGRIYAYMMDDSTNAVAVNTVSATLPFVWATGDVFTFTAKVPISEYAGLSDD